MWSQNCKNWELRIKRCGSFLINSTNFFMICNPPSEDLTKLGINIILLFLYEIMQIFHLQASQFWIQEGSNFQNFSPSLSLDCFLKSLSDESSFKLNQLLQTDYTLNKPVGAVVYFLSKTCFSTYYLLLVQYFA